MKGSQGVRILIGALFIVCFSYINSQVGAYLKTTVSADISQFFNSFIYFIPKYNAVKREEGMSSRNAIAQVLNISFPSQLPRTHQDVSNNAPKSSDGKANNGEHTQTTKNIEPADSKQLLASSRKIKDIM